MKKKEGRNNHKITRWEHKWYNTVENNIGKFIPIILNTSIKWANTQETKIY